MERAVFESELGLGLTSVGTAAELDLSLAKVNIECDQDYEEPVVIGVEGAVAESGLSLANTGCDRDTEVQELTVRMRGETSSELKMSLAIEILKLGKVTLNPPSEWHS